MIGSVRSYLGAAIDGRAALDRGLEIAFRLHRFWAATNVAEGRFWLSRLLAQAAGGEWHGYATFALGYLTYWAGDADVAVSQLESAAEALREKDVTYAAHSLIYLAGLLDDLDRVTEALACVDRAIEASSRVESVDLQVAALSGVGCVLGERADPSAAAHMVHAAQLCREGGTPAQLAAVLSTAAMVCWQAGDFTQARAFVTEAEPLHRDNRRIARVVWLSVAAALELQRGDVAAALDRSRRADAEGTALGVERELPLLRCIRALACLASQDPAEASAHAQAALRAAQALTYTFPIALCLETAAAVLDAAVDADTAGLASLLATAAAIRRRGDRPIPPSLSPILGPLHDRHAGAVGTGEVLDAASATRYALALLEGGRRLTESGWHGLAMDAPTGPPDTVGDGLVADAVALVTDWLRDSEAALSGRQRRERRRFQLLTGDARSLAFTMAFCDRVLRPESAAVAAAQLRAVAEGPTPPSSASPIASCSAPECAWRPGRHSW